MDSATLIKSARLAAGMSLRQLAEAAQTSAAAVSLYETGKRIPQVDTLARIIAATGSTLVLDSARAAPIDELRNGAVLVDVLDLAEFLPFAPAANLGAPVFAELAQ